MPRWNNKSHEKDRFENYGRQWFSRSKYHSRQGYHLRYQDHFLSMLPLDSRSHILECGSGDGEIERRLEKMRPDIRVEYYCLDVSRTLLEHIVASKGTLQGFSIKAVNATIESIPFKSESMDVVFALSVLWYVPDIIASVKEMYRVLKPGGTLCFDVVSLLHPTGMIGSMTNLLTNRFQNSYRMNYIFPSRLASCLRKKGMSVSYTGFLPVLPTALPLVGDRLNIFQCFDWLPATENPVLRDLCNKVVFRINK